MEEKLNNQRSKILQGDIDQAKRDLMLAALEQIKHQEQQSPVVSETPEANDADEIDEADENMLISMEERAFLNGDMGQEVLASVASADDEDDSYEDDDEEWGEIAEEDEEVQEKAPLKHQEDDSEQGSAEIEPEIISIESLISPVQQDVPESSKCQSDQDFTVEANRYDISTEFTNDLMDQIVADDIKWYKQQG